MREKILNTLIQSDKFLCIEVHFGDSDKTYRAVEVVRKKNNLSLINSFIARDLNTLLQQIPKNNPTILSFSGQGIITKKVENTPNYQSTILFNANTEDFYWFEIPQSNHIYVSIIRKTTLFDEIEYLENQGISIVDVSVGPFITIALKPLLPSNLSILTPSFELKFDKDTITGFAKRQTKEKKTEQYFLGEEKVGVIHIIPFSSLLFYLYPNETIKADKEFLKSKRQEFKFKKAFNVIGAIGLMLLLTTLLSSYLMLRYYQAEYMELQVKLGEENIAYNKLILLELDQKNKEAILRESGLNDSRFLASYISEIAKDIPPEISLIEMMVFPSKVKIKQKERIHFNNNLIQINGTVSSNQSFTAWIKKLKESDWVESLEIIDFKKDGSISTFEIRLILLLNV
ncbi:hypothetical protein [Allomuricauda sp. R78024]|uniref:hypothetical protein n=1 Tax=Allomuricauda sp. R78024 TaxID=3093867 RepID=UPI0037C85889